MDSLAFSTPLREFFLALSEFCFLSNVFLDDCWRRSCEDSAFHICEAMCGSSRFFISFCLYTCSSADDVDNPRYIRRSALVSTKAPNLIPTFLSHDLSVHQLGITGFGDTTVQLIKIKEAEKPFIAGIRMYTRADLRTRYAHQTTCPKCGYIPLVAFKQPTVNLNTSQHRDSWKYTATTRDV